VNNGNSPVVATIVVTPTFSNGSVSCTGAPVSFTITVNPTAQVNPVQSQVECNGASTTAVAFTSHNTGGTTTYSWTNDQPGIGLAASGTGNIGAFSAVNNGNFPVVSTIVVTPTFSNGSVTCTGAPISFTITVNPTAQVNPVQSQVVCNGASTTAVAFTSNNTGGTTTYSWTNDTPSIGLSSSGVGDIASFIAVNAKKSPVVATIRVTPTFTSGSVSCTGPIQSFTITINPDGKMFHPESQELCNGMVTSPVVFSSNNTGGTVTYLWTNDQPGIGLAASGSGNIPVFTALNTLNSPLIATISVTPVFTANSVSCPGATHTFTITVNPTAQVNPVQNQVVCNGSSSTAVVFTTSNMGGSTTYSWTNNTPSIGLPSSGTGNIGSFICTNAKSKPVVATIAVTPTYINGLTSCLGATVTFTITVNPSGRVNQPSNQVVCKNAQTSQVVFSTTNTGGVTSYSWTNSNPSIGLAASGTGNIASFMAMNSGTEPATATISVTAIFTNGQTSCPGETRVFTITVNPSAQMIQPIDQVVCNGSITSVNFMSLNTGGVTTYSWTCSDPSIGLPSSGTGNIPAFTAHNFGVIPVVAIISVTPVFTGNSVSCQGNTKTFSITVNPTPSVNAVSDQELCAGTATTPINFTGNIPGTVFTWTNSLPVIGLPASGSGNIPSFTTINQSADTLTAVVQVVPVFTNQGLGCNGQPTDFTITVNPTLPVSVSISASNTAVCQGTQVLFLATPVNGGQTPLYDWIVNGVPYFTADPYNDLLYTPTNGDIVECILHSSLTCVSGNPATSNAIPVTVYSKMPVSVTIDASSNPSCSGTPVTFTATPENGGQSPVFNWFVNGIPAGLNNPVYSYIPAEGDVVFCILTSSDTCITGNPDTSNHIIMHLNALPIPAISGPVVACEGFTGNVYATQPGMSNYTWTVSAGGIITSGGSPADNSVTITWSTPGAHQVAVNYTDPNGCTASSPAGFEVTVNPALPVSVQIAASSDSVCQGSSVTFITTPVNGGSAPQYQWYVNGVDMQANHPQFMYVPSDGDVVTCTLVSSEPCAVGSPATSNSITMTVNPLPVPMIEGPTSLCQGAAGNVYSTLPGMTAYSWSVSPGGIITGGTNSNQIIVTWNTAGSQQVSLNYTNSFGCQAAAPAVLNVTVDPALPVGVSINASSTAVCTGTNVTFTATPVNGGNNPVYLWKVNGNNTGNNNPVFTYAPASGDIVTCQMTSDISCASGNPATSNAVQITVNAYPVVYAISGGGSFCSGGSGAVIQVNASQTGINYFLYLDNNPVGLVVAGTGAAVVFPPQSLPGTYTVEAVDPGTGCSIMMSGAAIVTILPAPEPTLTGPAQVVAGTGGSVYITQMFMTGYTWTISSGGVITAGGTPTDHTVTVTWNNPGAQWVKVNYTDPQTGCAAPAPVQYDVTVTSPALFITITAPNGGEQWQQGTAHDITWTTNLTDNVKIALYKSGVLHSVIAPSVSPAGTYTWDVPSALTAGSDYRVRISRVSDPALFDMSNADFTITQGTVPENTVVQNVVVTSGQTQCFNATNMITVAGSGTTFLVETGGNATFIAGQNILYLPGTTVQPGGYMHGYIAPNGPWCGTQAPSIPSSSIVAGTGDISPAGAENWIRVYPNPTDGRFTLEIFGVDEKLSSDVLIRNMLGATVLKEDFGGQNKRIFDLENRPPGVYLITLTKGTLKGTAKIILK